MKNYESKDEIEVYVLDYFRQRWNAEAEPESIIDNLGLDSLDRLDFICDFEDEFDVDFSVEQVGDLDTINKCVNYIFININEGRRCLFNSGD